MIPNLVLLTGEDDFRLRERLRFYESVFKKKYPNGDIDFLNEEQALLDLKNSIQTPNLFGDKRLIFTENFWTPDVFAAAEKINFFSLLESNSDLCTLFIIEPKLDKRLKSSQFFLGKKNTPPAAKIESFDPFDTNTTIEWAMTYAEKHNGKLLRKEADFLVSRCGQNLWNLSQEIKKLSLYCQDNHITQQAIETLTIPHPQALIWDFLSALSAQKSQKAFEHFKNLIASQTSPHEILPLLFREIRIHTQIQDGLTQGLSSKSIASETGLHPFILQKTMPLTRNFSLELLERLYDMLFDIDTQIKTGKIIVSSGDTTELEFALEKFIVAACK